MEQEKICKSMHHYAWFIKSSAPATHNTDVTMSDNGVLMCYLELNCRGYGHKSFKEGAK